MNERPFDALAIDRVLAGGGEMGRMMRAVDWAATPLGQVGRWPQSLRTAVSIMLDSRFAMVVAWGPEFIRASADDPTVRPPHTRDWRWADLLRRAFDMDALACPPF